MKQVTIPNNTSVLDVAISYYGSADMAIKVLQDNDLNQLHMTIPQGTVLYIDESAIVNQRVVDYFKENGASATGYEGAGIGPLPGGDFNNDFNNDFA